MVSKKEQILEQVEKRISEIKKTNIAHDDVYYENDVGYVDRQFNNITPKDIKEHGTNWVIINENKETHSPLIGGGFEHTIQLQIIGFVQASQNEHNLSTLINSLQRDIKVAMLKDVELDRLCSYLIPVSNQLVENMIYPFGGFVMYIDIVYTTQGLEI